MPFPPTPVSVGTGHRPQSLRPSHLLGDTESYRETRLPFHRSLSLSPLLLLGNRDRHIQLHIHSSFWIGGERVEGVASCPRPRGLKEESPASFLLHLRYCDLFLF